MARRASDRKAIEAEIDRVRSLGLDELRPTVAPGLEGGYMDFSNRPIAVHADEESISTDAISPPARSVPPLPWNGASLDALRSEWRRLYHSEPPRLSRELLVRAIGYRLQELEHGGLGKATRRKLQTLAKVIRTTGRIGPAPSLSLKPGARLVREWHGRTHTVTVTEDGFEYSGTIYPSLTKIAKKITDAHWSGPRFFGLVAAGAPRPSNGGGNG